MSPTPQPSILLVGPTGSGKTPLGRLFEVRGWRGRRCHHFDFGAELRAAAAGEGGAAGLLPDELTTIRRSLRTGALLEDADFFLALKVLRDYCVRHAVGRDDRLVLNGLPRHAGQAAMLEAVALVDIVVVLEAPPEVVRERIRLDMGGDRAGRSDDDLAAVEQKLEVFRARTLPLVNDYGARGAAVVRIPVTMESTAEGMWDILARSV